MIFAMSMGARPRECAKNGKHDIYPDIPDPCIREATQESCANIPKGRHGIQVSDPKKEGGYAIYPRPPSLRGDDSDMFELVMNKFTIPPQGPM